MPHSVNIFLPFKMLCLTTEECNENESCTAVMIKTIYYVSHFIINVNIWKTIGFEPIVIIVTLSDTIITLVTLSDTNTIRYNNNVSNTNSYNSNVGNTIRYNNNVSNTTMYLTHFEKSHTVLYKEIITHLQI